MEQFEKPTIRTVAVHFIVTMVLQYVGVGMCMIAPGNPNKGALFNATPPLLFMIPAVLVACRAAWLLRRPRSDHSKGWPLWLTLPLCLGAVFLIPVLFFEVLFWVLEH